jgi:hypothetical protein
MGMRSSDNLSKNRLASRMHTGTFCGVMPLLVQQPIRGDRGVEDRASWKPDVPFLAGSFEGPTEKNQSHSTTALLRMSHR